MSSVIFVVNLVLHAGLLLRVVIVFRDCNKTYKRYSGYPGGLKIIKFKRMFEKNPKSILEKAVEGMLPKNRLKKTMMKNLILE